jgi:hypothetical protein
MIAERYVLIAGHGQSGTNATAVERILHGSVMRDWWNIG